MLLTTQAEKDFPSWIFFQHPPLLIAQREAPEAIQPNKERHDKWVCANICIYITKQIQVMIEIASFISVLGNLKIEAGC